MSSRKAILFDFGDTLASTDPPFILRIAMAIRAAGFEISDREFEEEYLRADYKLYLKHKERGGITPEEHMKWFLPLLYESLSPARDIDKFRQRVRAEMSAIEFTRVALPGVLELLDSLKGRGYKLGVISNNDGRTEEKCAEVGIRDHFDVILDSTNLGMVKPDSRIFHYALDRLGISPGEALYIGDLYGSDVLGGRDAGLDVIWFNGRKIEKFNDAEVTEVSELSEIVDFLD